MYREEGLTWEDSLDWKDPLLLCMSLFWVYSKLSNAQVLLLRTSLQWKYKYLDWHIFRISCGKHICSTLINWQNPELSESRTISETIGKINICSGFPHKIFSDIFVSVWQYHITRDHIVESVSFIWPTTHQNMKGCTVYCMYKNGIQDTDNSFREINSSVPTRR